MKRSDRNKVTKKSITKRATTKKVTYTLPKSKKIASLKPAVKGKGQKGTTKGGTLPNPFDFDKHKDLQSTYEKLTTEEMIRAYEKARKRVNTQFNKLVILGIADYSEAYVGTREAGEFVGKDNKVGFAKKFNEVQYKGKIYKNGREVLPIMTEKQFRRRLTAEYKEIYTLLDKDRTKTLYITAKDIQERRTQYEIDNAMESKLERLGIKPEDLQYEENLKEYKDYWALYDALKKQNLIGPGTAFGLSSDDVQDLVMQYYLDNRDRYIDFDRIAEEIKTDYDNTIGKYVEDYDKDALMYSHYFENKRDFNKLSYEAQKLAKLLARENYGTKPVYESFKQEKGKDISDILREKQEGRG